MASSLTLEDLIFCCCCFCCCCCCCCCCVAVLSLSHLFGCYRYWYLISARLAALEPSLCCWRVCTVSFVVCHVSPRSFAAVKHSLLPPVNVDWFISIQSRGIASGTWSHRPVASILHRLFRLAIAADWLPHSNCIHSFLIGCVQELLDFGLRRVELII